MVEGTEIETEGIAMETETGDCSSCGLECFTLYQVRDYLNKNKDLLRRYRGTDEENPPGISYATLVRWVQKKGVFPRAHLVGSFWAIPVCDLKGIEDRLPIRGNPHWIHDNPDFPRKAKENYVWGALPLELARKLYALEPYQLGSGEEPKPYALRLIREHLQELPEEFRNPAKYPRIQLGRKLAALARTTLENVSPAT